MRGVLGAAAEVLLWPFGIRRKQRRTGRDNDEGGPAPDDEDGWEVDFVHFVGATTGVAIAWWAMGRMKALQAPPAASGSSSGSSSVVASIVPRLAMSDFFRLLRAGAVTAVTYMADRPPAGALMVKTSSPLALAPGAQALVPAAGSAAVAGPCVAETLLLPGSHQGLFEELRACKNLHFECAEVGGDGDTDMNKLSLLIDIGGLLASIIALGYLLKSTGQGPFSGRLLGEESGQGSAELERRPAVTFGDVAGMEKTKEELREVISFLRHPSSFYALGARPPRGILLAGPSGTGKTLMARAVAGEAGVPFLYQSSAAFVEVYVGQGAQRVRQFYEQARSCAPCIVFLDELDALGAARQGSAPGGNQEYAQTLNQLLLELDGIESRTPAAGTEGDIDASQFVVTMAATNRYDCLDEALVRPGRIDRVVIVGLPNFAERVATLQIHARKLRHEGLDFEALARRTDGRSGADLAALLNDAALLAARRRAEAVRMEHILEVLANPRPQQQRFQAAGPADGPADGWWPAEGGPERSELNPEVFRGLLAAAAAAMAGQGPAMPSTSNLD